MGMTVTANVVFGFELEAIPVMEKTTKYHEDTGEPYAVQVLSRRVGLCQGKQVVPDLDAVLNGEGCEGLEVFRAGLYGILANRFWIGKALASMEFEPGAILVSQVKTDPVKEFARKHQIQPNAYLILYMS